MLYLVGAEGFNLVGSQTDDLVGGQQRNLVGGKAGDGVRRQNVDIVRAQCPGKPLSSAQPVGWRSAHGLIQ